MRHVEEGSSKGRPTHVVRASGKRVLLSAGLGKGGSKALGFSYGHGKVKACSI